MAAIAAARNRNFHCRGNRRVVATETTQRVRAACAGAIVQLAFAGAVMLISNQEGRYSRLCSKGKHMAPADPARRAVLRAEAISKVYRTGSVAVQALQSVDLALQEQEMVVLLGASGSGKSTLLNILGGLDRPSTGRVWFHDQELTTLPDAALTRYRRDNVGFVFQFYNLVPSLTARENVALVTEIAAHPMRPEEALERVGLGQRLNHFPAELSGGEQQRVAIARAIAKRPALLLCDEPTGALDSKTGITVLEALVEVNRALGAATVLITHNAAIQAIADRVIVMADGRISSDSRNPSPVAPAQVSW